MIGDRCVAPAELMKMMLACSIKVALLRSADCGCSSLLSYKGFAPPELLLGKGRF